MTTDTKALRALLDEMARIGGLIATQDSRCTDKPMFIVQQKREYVAHVDYEYDRIAWIHSDGEADADEAAELEKSYGETCDVPDGWNRCAIGYTWEFVTACFTQRGCEHYIAINGHNLEEHRIYAASSYRNNEWRAVREFLKGAAPALLDAADERDALRLEVARLQEEKLEIAEIAFDFLHDRWDMDAVPLNKIKAALTGATK